MTLEARDRSIERASTSCPYARDSASRATRHPDDHAYSHTYLDVIERPLAEELNFLSSRHLERPQKADVRAKTRRDVRASVPRRPVGRTLGGSVGRTFGHSAGRSVGRTRPPARRGVSVLYVYTHTRVLTYYTSYMAVCVTHTSTDTHTHTHTHTQHTHTERDTHTQHTHTQRDTDTHTVYTHTHVSVVCLRRAWF